MPGSWETLHAFLFAFFLSFAERYLPGTSLLPFSAELLFSLDHEQDPEKLTVILDLIYGATHSFIVTWSPGDLQSGHSCQDLLRDTQQHLYAYKQRTASIKRPSVSFS